MVATRLHWKVFFGYFLPLLNKPQAASPVWKTFSFLEIQRTSARRPTSSTTRSCVEFPSLRKLRHESTPTDGSYEGCRRRTKNLMGDYWKCRRCLLIIRYNQGNYWTGQPSRVMNSWSTNHKHLFKACIRRNRLLQRRSIPITTSIGKCELAVRHYCNAN